MAVIEKNSCFLSKQAKSGVAEVAHFCRAASRAINTLKCRGEQQVCILESLLSDNTLCFIHVQKKTVILLKVLSHFAESLYCSFSESQSEGRSGQPGWCGREPGEHPWLNPALCACV